MPADPHISPSFCSAAWHPQILISPRTALVNQDEGRMVSYWETPQDAKVLLRQVGRQFSPSEDGLLAPLPQELIAMDHAAQDDLQLRTDVLQ